MELYSNKIVKNNIIQPIYGLALNFDKKATSATKEQKDLVNKAFKILKTNYKNTESL